MKFITEKGKLIALITVLLLTNNQFGTTQAGKGIFSSKKSSSRGSSRSKRATPLSDDFVVKSCQQGLDFVSINDFESFIKQYKSRTLDQLQNDKTLPSACVENRKAILDLEKLITRRHVCEPNKIDQLIEYHNKYFKTKRHIFAKQRKNKLLTHKFFTKYAIQVAYTCKKNLLSNLELSKDELQARSKVVEEATEKVFKEEPSIKSNIKLIEEQANEPVGTNLKPRDPVEKELDEYRIALTQLKRPEDILTFDQAECAGSAHRKINIEKDKVNTLFKPAMVCLEFSRYYRGTILSIAKLANVGYMALEEKLDVQLADSPLVKDWILLTQVCEPLLHTSMERVEAEQAVLDTCSERVNTIEVMGYEDHIDELDIEMLEQMLPRNEATRKSAQKIMKSIRRNMLKANIMKKLKSGEITKKSIFLSSLNTLNEPPKRDTKNCVPTDEKDFTFSSLNAGAYKVSTNGGPNDMDEQSSSRSCDEQSFGELMEVLSNDALSNDYKPTPEEEDENIVGGTIATSIIVIALMFVFEWVFFLIMTLVARVCYRLNMNFDNLLTFPPKVFSRSDSDFAEFTARLDKIDEDDFFDYSELNAEEKKQRDLLGKIFGRPPPMLFRDLSSM